MTQKITKSVKSMVEAAKREIEEIEPAQAVKLHGRDDVVLVDLRDPREMERDGRVPDAFRMTRGMLEFWIDPESPYFKPIFAADKKFVFFCAGCAFGSGCSMAPPASRQAPKPPAICATGFSPMRLAVAAASAERQPPAQKNTNFLSSAKTGL